MLGMKAVFPLHRSLTPLLTNQIAFASDLMTMRQVNCGEAETGESSRHDQINEKWLLDGNASIKQITSAHHRI